MAILWFFLSLTLVIKQCTKRPQLWGSRWLVNPQKQQRQLDELFDEVGVLAALHCLKLSSETASIA